MSKKLNITRYFKKRTKQPHFSLSVFVTTLKMFFIFALVLMFAGFGAIIGVARGYMEASPVLDLRRIEEQAEASFIYDKNGNLITTFHGIENRIWSSIDDIPDVLEDAFIAIEDIRFYSHIGIDPKRIAGAFVSNLMNESVQGGSTITQQLIKNTILTPERSYKRKIQEAYLAIQLESKYDKDQILEAYLNTIYLGNGNHGVKTAALDYFGKDIQDLTLREAAVLAGTARSPARYNPRRNMHDPSRRPEILFNRANLVLQVMHENEFITQQQYESARFGEDEKNGRFADGFKVEEQPSNQELYPMVHFIEYMIHDVRDRLMMQNGWEGEEGERQAMDFIKEGGLHIYTTVDSEIQQTVEDVLRTYENFPTMANPQDAIFRDAEGDETQQPQAAALIIDHNTGQIRAMVGSRTPPIGRFLLNRANMEWPVGSAIKPIAIYAPFIEAGYPGGIMLENIPVPITGWDIGGGQWGYPRNFGGGSYTGLVDARMALVRSFNTTSARAVFRVTQDYSAQKLSELGITSEYYIEQQNPSDLALGSNGINMVEFTAAYAAIANRGVYQKPISFTRVLDRDGNEILNSSSFQIRRAVFKESTAFIITEWLQDAVRGEGGTGRRAAFGNMPIAGKTGTNQDFKGISFAGFTPHYTAAVWIGHDRWRPLERGASAGVFAAPLWRAIMEPIHYGLEEKPFFAEVPEDVIKMTVCAISGMLPNGTLCDANLITEWFPRNAVPRERCTLHQAIIICRFSGKLLSPFCPPEHAVQSSLIVLPENSPFMQLTDEDLAKFLPGAIRGNLLGITDLSSLDYFDPIHAQLFCPLHTQQWADAELYRLPLSQTAWPLIYQVNANIVHPEYSSKLLAEDRARLINSIATLRAALQQGLVEPPAVGQPRLTQIPIFDPYPVEMQITALQHLNNTIFGAIRTELELERNQLFQPPAVEEVASPIATEVTALERDQLFQPPAVEGWDEPAS